MKKEKYKSKLEKLIDLMPCKIGDYSLRILPLKDMLGHKSYWIGYKKDHEYGVDEMHFERNESLYSAARSMVNYLIKEGFLKKEINLA